MREGKSMTASIAATRRMPARLLALAITSVAAAVMRSRAGSGMHVEVFTLPCWMWSLMNPEWRRQWVMAVEALTNSGPVVLAASLSRAAF